MDAAYLLKTRSVPVEAYLGAGRTVRGEVFLHGGAVAHAGDETIIDLMNDPLPFFPLRSLDGGTSALLVAKTHVRYMSVPPLGTDARIALARLAATRLEVTLEVSDGETLFGVIHAQMPPGHRRALDFLNAPGNAFIDLVQDGRDCLVNRAHIHHVRDCDPAIDAPLQEG